MNDPSQPVVPGQILAGKYRVERIVGEGGMGVVVAAVHIELQERVAIKFVRPDHAHVPEVVARFTREARASAKIRSEHVVRVTDVGRLETGVPYMVMEYLEGKDLSQLIAARPKLDGPLAVHILLQACEAVGEAHTLGIVHRDLKPANMFLLRRPDDAPYVKVLDFGISKMTEAGLEQVSLTRTSAVLGSPLYMAPEQMTRSKDAGPSVDIWALGVVLYEMLAGHPPFLGESVPEVCARIAAEPHAPLAAERPDLPQELLAVVDRCLAKRPADRFASVAQLAKALGPVAPPDASVSLRRIAALEGQVSAGTSSQPDFSPGALAATAGSWVKPPAPKGRRVALASTIGVASAVAFIAIAFWIAHAVRSRGPSSLVSPPSVETTVENPATVPPSSPPSTLTSAPISPPATSAPPTGTASHRTPPQVTHAPTTHPSHPAATTSTSPFDTRK